MARDVVFLRSAQADLTAILDYISDQAGFVIAHNYVNRIEDVCLSLALFPERGTPHDNIRPGLRKIGFERRATILFQVLPQTIEIVAIAYGGRDWQTALRQDE